MNTLKNNYILIIFGFLILVIIGQSFYFNYKLKRQRKFVENEIQIVKDSINVLEARERIIIYQGIDNTTKAKKSSTTLKNKLKQDETDIDNSDVTDDDIEKYIAKYRD